MSILLAEMSLSDSDSDEFFDAEDVSLNVAGLSTEPTSLDSGNDVVDREALRLKASEVL